ncbi:unnamed protein product, partial [Closterium sp. NIES-53]
MLLPTSSWGSPPTPLGGSSTTPPLDVFCPPKTSRSTNAVEPVEATGDSGAAAGAEPGGAGTRGAERG